MSRWVEPEDRDEAPERELFERRARALGDPRVPSVAEVLREAASPSSRAGARREHGWVQVVGSVCVAAAALLGAVRSIPYGAVDRGSPRGPADADGGAQVALGSDNDGVSWPSATAACSPEESAAASCDSCCSRAEPAEPSTELLVCQDELQP